MKLAQHNNSLDTNSKGESKGFGIGDASVVIEILRNRLYENKIQTLVQEYICNARDAMREVGKGNDFEVTMPTRLQPTFRVRDFGPGISPDRMDNVFRLYGASTKRGSNNQTGGFGIGAKSAWSYTDSFTVVTIVDGTRRTYVCHTGHNNQGSLDLVSTDHTDEANGTEIQVGVKQNDLSEFQESVYRAIYFWEVRPTVKGGNEDLPALTPGYSLSPNIETIDKNMIPDFIGLDYRTKALAVIDGVPYALTEKLLNKASKLGKFLEENLRKTAILHLPNGIVEVSASRESIADSQFSIDALNRMGTQGAALVKAHLKSEFSQVKTTGEWIAAYAKLVSYFDVEKEAKFGDYYIENGYICSENFKSIKMSVAHNLDKRGRHNVDRLTKHELTRDDDKRISVEVLDHIFVVTKQENKIIQNKRIRQFLTGVRKVMSSKVILLEVNSDKEVLAKIVADLNVKTFESIDYPIVEKAERVKIERENSEFCMHTFNSTHRYTTLAKNTTKYLYVPIDKANNWGSFGHKSQLSDLNDHTRSQYQLEIVGVAERALKMVQGNENFTLLSDWIAAYKPNKAEINYTVRSEARNDDDMQTLMEVEGIKDEFLNEMIKEYKGILGEARKISHIPDMLKRIVKEATSAKDFIERDAKLAELLKTNYPLVSEIGRHADMKVKKNLRFILTQSTINVGVTENVKMNYHVLNESIVLNYDGKTEIISETDYKRYAKVLKLIQESKTDDTALDRIREVLESEFKAFEGSGLELRDGKLWDGSTALPDALTSRILKFRDLELPLGPLLNFWANLKSNPSFNSRQMLYKFLEHNGHPLTEDGSFIAYRGVREDFKDKHTGTFDNSPGQKLEMPRDEVDDNPNNTCSNGLHVACYDYAKGFGQKLVEVKVNPMDVVAVPTDYNGTKMRVCKFEVIQECAEMRKEEVYNNPKSVHSTEEDDSDDSDDLDLCGVNDCENDNDCDEHCPGCGEDKDAFANYCAQCGEAF